MSKLSKGYFATLKGKKVVFEVVRSFGDIKVKFVEHFGDYKVQIDNSPSFSTETIKIEVVEHFEDVRLQKVDHFGDFKAYIK